MSSTGALPGATNSRIIRLRLQASEDEHVVLDERNLPANVYDVTSLLKLETAPRSSWRDVAVAYYRSGKTADAIKVLEQASADDMDNMLGDAAGDAYSRTDLLAALAGAYVMAADDATTPQAERPELLRKAADVFSRADLIDTDQPAIWTAKGAAEAAAGRADDAKTWFENAHAHQDSSVAAALGLAAIVLNGTASSPPNPQRAANLLVTALSNAPCPAGTWTGLGYALFRAGRTNHARTILRRAVKATEHSQPEERKEALYALARVESSEKTQASIENACLALREAYLHCGGHSDPRVLTLLAEIYFLGGDAKLAQGFATRALALAADLPGKARGTVYAAIKCAVVAQAHFERGRARMAMGDVEAATTDFEKTKKTIEEISGEGTRGVAVKMNPGLFLRLGLLKLATGREEDEPLAQECLEKILAHHDERCAVALRGLGVLLGRREIMAFPAGRPRSGEKLDRARDLLRRGIQADEEGRTDVAAMLVYAALIEESDPRNAIIMLETSVSVIEKQDDTTVPVEVTSNLVALLARVGRVKEARRIATEKLDEAFLRSSVPMMYNTARLAELDNDIDKARKGYEEVLKKSPYHEESTLRLGCITMYHDHDMKKAEEMFKRVLVSKSTCHTVAAAFLNKLYAWTKNPRAQQDLLEKTRVGSDYMSVAFAQFMHSHLEGVGTSERRERFLVNHIATPLLYILKHSKRNAFAVNGIGVYYAESGMLAEARDAFSAAGSGAEVAKSSRVNLAHTTIALAKASVRSQNERATPGIRFTTASVDSARGLCEQAGKLYADSYDEIRNNASTDPGATRERLELLLYMANAKHEVGSYREAANLVEKVLRISPESAPCWLNLGQLLRECASQRVLRCNKNVQEMLIAKSELEGARAAFIKAAHLDCGTLDPVTRTRIDRKFLEHHTKFIQQALRTHEVSLVNARNEAEDKEKIRLEKLAEIREVERKKEEERKKQEEKRLARQRELEKAAAAAAAKLEEVNEVARLEAERKRAAETKEDDALSGDEQYNGARGSKSSKKKKRKKKEDVEDVKPSKRRKSKARGYDDVDESSDEYGDDELTENGNRDASPPSPESRKRRTRDSDGDGASDGDVDALSRPSARRRFSLAEDVSDDDV